MASARRPSCRGAPTAAGLGERAGARGESGRARGSRAAPPSPRPAAAGRPGPSPPPRAAHRRPADPSARARALVRRPRGGLQAADSMSGGGDVVCTGWLRKSPPEKKLRRYVSAGGSGCGRRGRERGALRGLPRGWGLREGRRRRGGRAPGKGVVRGAAGGSRGSGLCEAPAHLSQVRCEGRGGPATRLRLRLVLRGSGAAAAPL